MDLPLLEDDRGEPGVIEAHMMHPGEHDVAPAGVLCFFNDVLERLAAEGRLREVYVLHSEIGHNPVYELAPTTARSPWCTPASARRWPRVRRGGRVDSACGPSSRAAARVPWSTTWPWAR